MKYFHLFFFSIILLFAKQIKGQVGINSTSSAPAASAMLDVSSTNKGLLIPRMTTAQRTGITSPAIGLTVYDTDTQGFWFHNGSSWQNLVTVSNNFWQANGTNIYNNNTGNVGIGINSPAFGLDVRQQAGTVFSIQEGATAPNTVRILKDKLASSTNVSTAALFVETNGNFFGIQAFSELRSGVYGQSINGNGLSGISQNLFGVIGRSTNSSGVYGSSGNTIGVEGFSTIGTGVSANSESAKSIYAYKSISQTGLTALIENENPSNTSTLLQLNQNSSGSALLVNTSTSTGVELLNSSIKVSGTNKMAFQVASAGVNPILIPNTGFANSPTDIILLTRVVAVNLSTTVYLKFVSGAWNIFTENGSVIPSGESFNVLVFKQ